MFSTSSSRSSAGVLAWHVARSKGVQGGRRAQLERSSQESTGKERRNMEIHWKYIGNTLEIA